MNTHEIRVQAVVEQLLASVLEPWESLKQTLNTHSPAQMGPQEEEGSGAWHMLHLAEVFRIHARTVMDDEIDIWAEYEPSAAGAAKGVMDDVEVFATWCRANPQRCSTVDHGGEMSFEEMVGVMLRHIVWHAAAVHYWCLWRG